VCCSPRSLRSCWWAGFHTAIQRTTIADELRGRVASFNIFVVAAAHARAIFEGGVIASFFAAMLGRVGGLLNLVDVGAIAALVPRFARRRVGVPP